MAAKIFQVPFPKLDAHNYLHWSKRAQVWLEAKEVWAAYVQRRRPTVMVPADATAEQCADADAQNREHERRDTKARCMLMVAIEDSQMPHVEALRSAFEIWEALKCVHHRTTPKAKLNIIRALHEMRLRRGDSVIEHTSQMIDYLNQLVLASLGINHSENIKVYTLLSSLHEGLENLVLTLQVLPEDQLNMNSVAGRLCEQESQYQQNRLEKSTAGCSGNSQHVEEGQLADRLAKRFLKCLLWPERFT